MARILVVYYSRSGNTRTVALELAQRLGADLEEISDPTRRNGVRGYLRSGRQAFFGTIVPIAASQQDPADYDLVVVGTPIWNVSLSAPVRSYLRRHQGRLPAVAFFCTCGGHGHKRVFGQMLRETGTSPLASLVVREAELGQPAGQQAIFAFEDQLRGFVAPVRTHEHASWLGQGPASGGSEILTGR